MERIIKSVSLEGNEVSVKVISPNAKAVRDGQAAYNKVFRESLENGSLLRQKLGEYMEEQGLWDEAKELKYAEIMQAIAQDEETLQSGGIPLSEAKEIAFGLKAKRAQFTELISERNQLDAMTAEGTADNARFNSLVVSCVLNLSGGQIWNSIEDYDLEANEPWAVEAASALANMIYGIDENYDQTRVEHKFLVEYKFTDEKGRRINEEGHLVDNEGRLINEENHYIKYDDEGNEIRITKDGEEMDENGNVVTKFSPFLDDSGKPVTPPSEEEKEEPKKPARRTRKSTAKS
jgi:hypothetical protein